MMLNPIPLGILARNLPEPSNPLGILARNLPEPSNPLGILARNLPEPSNPLGILARNLPESCKILQCTFGNIPLYSKHTMHFRWSFIFSTYGLYVLPGSTFAPFEEVKVPVSNSAEFFISAPWKI